MWPEVVWAFNGWSMQQMVNILRSVNGQAKHDQKFDRAVTQFVNKDTHVAWYYISIICWWGRYLKLSTRGKRYRPISMDWILNTVASILMFIGILRIQQSYAQFFPGYVHTIRSLKWLKVPTLLTLWSHLKDRSKEAGF